MTTARTWTFTDRTRWSVGPWDDEPDKVEWRDEATGYPCIARRSPTSGAWCGYVAVPPGHPSHGADYDDVGASVHGGLTYAAPCGVDTEHGICHVPAAGEPADVWWLGFDCNHYLDRAPAYQSIIGDEVYRDLAYVQAETANLATQLHVIGSDR